MEATHVHRNLRRASREFTLNAPSRDYGLLAEILLRADEDDPAARGAIERTARALGTELGQQAGDLDTVEILRQRGYEPFDDEGTIRFRNCPFDALVQRHRTPVCALNLALVQGIIAGAGSSDRAALEPDRAVCCVAVSPRPGSRRSP